MNTECIDEESLRNNFNVHDHLKEKSIEELYDINMQARLPYAVCILNIEGNLNIGMTIRTACNLGAERVIVIGRKHYDKRSCVGSNHYFPIDVIKAYDFHSQQYEIDEFWNAMNKYNYRPFLMETGGKPIHAGTFKRLVQIAKIKNLPKPCLVFGSESAGLPKEIIDDPRSTVYSIPQLGVIRSFNVSSAAAISMWELTRCMI